MSRSVSVVLCLCLALAPAAAAADQRGDAKEQVEFGIQVAQRGLWREAIYRWERATQLDPTYAAAFNNLAVAYEHEGQLDKARSAYEKAIEIEPDNTMIRQNFDLFKEINDRAAKKTVNSLLLVLVGALAGCTSYFEIPIETPIQPKLDVAAFQRVLVAGFIAGGDEEVDANLETVRLLRSQLRQKGSLRVIEAEALPLAEIAAQQGGLVVAPPSSPADTAATVDLQLPPIKEEKDFEPYEKIFANTEYWKKIGEEHQQPLIVTGTVLFRPHASSGFVQREQEIYDSFGRRRVVPQRVYMERKGFILRPSFIFIDGRTGETLHSETFREEILYNQNTQTPALSSYFELMDRLLPTFLNAMSAQKIRGTRVLLK